MKLRKPLFFTVLALIQLCLIWPIYPLFSDTTPYVLGLPFSFFWVILMLVCSFTALLLYYLTEPADFPSTDKPG